MKTIFRIFLSDIKKIRTNLMAFAVMIGICILPALYAWFNIAANWDPYSISRLRSQTAIMALSLLQRISTSAIR